MTSEVVSGAGHGLPQDIRVCAEKELSSAPLVSVVVPAHNAETHIVACLASLAAQTLARCEVIVVLDGPTDSTPELAEQFVSEAGFRLLKLSENSGPSAARNLGIDAAKGQYVGFVDADDVVTPEMFESLVRAALSADADIASSGHRRVDEDGRLLSVHEFPLTADRPLDRAALRAELMHPHRSTMLWFAVRSIFRRSMLDAYGVRFDPNVRMGEDVLFNLLAFAHAERWVRVSGSPYSYRSTSESATSVRWRPDLVPALSNAHERKLAIFQEFGLLPAALEDTHLYVLRNLFPRMLRNAAHHPDPQQRVLAVQEVLSAEFVRSSLLSASYWDGRLARGLRVMVALARLNRARALLYYAARKSGNSRR